MYTNLKKAGIKAIAGIIALLCTITCFAFTASADTEDVNLQIDVMFVIDGSGSMLKTDPNYVSRAASNLFTDMCIYDEDNRSRAGFVVYSTEIEKEQRLTELTENNRKSLKNALKINHSYKDTDISLGLTRAKNMLIDGGALSNGSSPMIILLSDGNTEFDKLTSERKAEYDAEYKNTLEFLSNNDIPVYSIALKGTSGYTNEQEMKDIAQKTGGKSYSVDSADDLPNTLSEIMADRIGSTLQPIKTFELSENSIDIPVEISDGQIVVANIIINSSKGIKTENVRNPDGINIDPNDLKNKSIVSSSVNGTSTVVQLKNPKEGTWTITLSGTKGDNVVISLLSAYDMKFGLKANKHTIPNENAVNFEVYFEETPGKPVENLLDGAECVLTIKNDNTGKEVQADMAQNGNVHEKSYTFNEAGHYTVTCKVFGDGGAFERNTNEIKITVNPLPLKLSDAGEGKITLFSPLLGMKVLNKAELTLGDIFSWDKGAILEISPVGSGWDEICNFIYDKKTNLITVNAIRSGNAEIAIMAKDNFGQTAEYTLKVNAIPGWLPLLLFIIFVIIIILLIIFIKKVTAPRLKGKLKLSLVLPDSITDLTPPEAEFELDILNKKGKVSLSTVLNSNITFGGMYNQALNAITGFIQKIAIEATNADCVSLNIYIPSPDKGIQLQFNNTPIAKSAKKTINTGMPSALTYSSFEGSYTINFSLGGEGGFGGEVFGDGFGGNAGFGNTNNSGLGGFGNTSSGGFGGFGDNKDSGSNSGGFGSGFGDSNNGNSNSGGFGNDNSGFNAF